MGSWTVLPIMLAMVVTILDQWTKSLVRQHLDLFENIILIPGFFDLRYIQNTGAAWGLFSGGHFWLAGLSLFVLGVMVVWHRHFFRNCVMDQIAFGFLAGGIIGNFIDRVRLQYVVDFLDFYWNGRHFPAFNVADSAICIGVGLLLMAQFMIMRSQHLEKKVRE